MSKRFIHVPQCRDCGRKVADGSFLKDGRCLICRSGQGIQKP